MKASLSPTDLLVRCTEASVGARALGAARAIIACAAVIKAVVVMPSLAALETQPLPLPIVPLPSLPWVFVTLVWCICGLLLLFGVGVPLSGALVAACAWYTLLLDERTYGNHLLLLALLATFIAATGGGSIRAGRKARVPGAAAFLLMTQITTLYAYAGIAKLNPSFLSGDVFLHSVGTESALITFPTEAVPAPLLAATAVAAVFLELFLAVGLWIGRLRRYAIVGGLALHTGIMLTMANPLNLLCFALLCWSTYPLFATWRPGVSPSHPAPPESHAVSEDLDQNAQGRPSD